MSRLVLASALVISALCGLVFAIGMLVLLKLQVPKELLLPIAAAFSIGMVLLQYALGPVLIDAVVKIRWTSSMELGPDFDLWLRKTCATFKIPMPRFGIIEEGSPNAFTYGNGPWNARVVVTRGVIDALEPEELKAVVAHELGHIRNRDFIVMTVVQALVLALYSLYIAARWSGRRNGGYVALLSFIAYQLSYYISLLLSRIREYMADFASGQIMSNGNDLSSALVKISYGMGRFQSAPPAGQTVPYPRGPYQPQPQPQPYPSAAYQAVPTAPPARPGQILLPPAGAQSVPPVQPAPPPVMSNDRITPELMAKLNAIQQAGDVRSGAAQTQAFGAQLFGGLPGGQALGAKPQKQQKQAPKFDTRALGAFGIASAASMRSAVTWGGQQGTVDPDHFTMGARWELYNPWARIAELVSTHPLTARRIQALQKLNARFNVKPAFDFSKIPPGRYAGFLGDLLVVATPWLFAMAGSAVGSLHRDPAGAPNYLAVVLAALCGFFLGCLFNLFATYRGSFLRGNVKRCLSELEVSHVRPVAIAIQGTFTGRLSAGMAWADDYILQDATGFVACILHQPFKWLDWAWGWMYSERFIGQEVIVHGWYRRFDAPYIEISHFQVVSTRETIRSYYFPAAIAGNLLLAAACGVGTAFLMR